MIHMLLLKKFVLISMMHHHHMRTVFILRQLSIWRLYEQAVAVFPREDIHMFSMEYCMKLVFLMEILLDWLL